MAGTGSHNSVSLGSPVCACARAAMEAVAAKKVEKNFFMSELLISILKVNVMRNQVTKIICCIF
jgi:hypothetical protein